MSGFPGGSSKEPGRIGTLKDIAGGVWLWDRDFYALRHLTRKWPGNRFFVQITKADAGPYAQACLVPGQLPTLVKEIRELENHLSAMPPDSIVYEFREGGGGLYLDPIGTLVEVRSEDLLSTLGRIRALIEEALAQSELVFVTADYQEIVA